MQTQNQQSETQRSDSISENQQLPTGPLALNDGLREYMELNARIKKLDEQEAEAKKPRAVLLDDFALAGKRFCTSGKFDVDTHNEQALIQIVHYMNGDVRFEGNLRKGICIAGPKGTGKSMIFKTINAMLQPKNRFGIDNLVTLAGYYSQKDIGDSCFNSILLSHNKGVPNHRLGNDLGREKETVQYMGNTEDVGARYIYERYELFQNQRIKTHFTTNFTDAGKFEQRYGDLNYDRIKEMCNFIFLNGPSRR